MTILTRLALSFTIACASLPVVAQAPPAGSEPSLDDLLAQTVSTASRSEQTTLDAAASVTVVTAEEIERFGYRNLGEILEWVRSFYLTDDRNYGYLGVRGFSRPTDYNNRIQLLIDGQQTNEPIFQMAYVGSEIGIDVRMIERIEIVRGPGATLYGAGAMLAVINVITRKGGDLDGTHVSFEAASGRQPLGASVAWGKQFASGTEVAISGSWTDADGEDVEFPELGIAEDLDWERSRGFTASLIAGDVRVTSYFSSRTRAYPTAAFGTDFNDPRSQAQDEVGGAQIVWENELSPTFQLSARTSGDWYHYEGVYPLDGFLSLDSADGRRWTAGLEGRWDFNSSNRLTAGVEYRDATRADYLAFDEDGVVYLDGEWPFDVRSMYAELESHLTPTLITTVGLRWDDYSNSGSSVSPRVALVWHPRDDSALKLLASEGLRAPSPFEANYELEADGVVANPDLDAETTRTYEVVWEQRLRGNLLGEASVFRNDFEGIIDYVELPDGSLQYQNLSGATSEGVEIGLTGRTAGNVILRGSLALQRTEDDTGEQLTNSPEQIVKAGVSAPFGSWLFASTEARWESSRRTVQETESSSFTLVNATLSTKELAGFLKLSLFARNLFDEEYSLPGGFEHVMATIPQYGREISLRADLRF